MVVDQDPCALPCTAPPIDPLRHAEPQVSPAGGMLSPLQSALSATMRSNPGDETLSLGLVQALSKTQRHMVRLGDVHDFTPMDSRMLVTPRRG